MRIGLSAWLLVIGIATAAMAQQPMGATPDSELGISPGEVKPTPEMWFYLQELRRYENPRVAVRKNAEFKAAQRMRRLAAQKWFGMSTARPMASPSPFTSTYSPYWASNSWDPYAWRGVGVGRSTVIVQPSGGTARTHSRW